MLKNIDKFLKNHQRKTKIIRHPILKKTILVKNREVKIIRQSRNSHISLDKDISYKNIIYVANKKNLKPNHRKSRKNFLNKEIQPKSMYREDFDDILNFYSNIQLNEKKISCDLQISSFPNMEFNNEDLNEFNNRLVEKQITAFDKNIENKYLRVDLIRRTDTLNYDYMFREYISVQNNIIRMDCGSIKLRDGASFYCPFNDLIIIKFKNGIREIIKIF